MPSSEQMFQQPNALGEKASSAHRPLFSGVSLPHSPSGKLQQQSLFAKSLHARTVHRPKHGSPAKVLDKHKPLLHGRILAGCTFAHRSLVSLVSLSRGVFLGCSNPCHLSTTRNW